MKFLTEMGKKLLLFAVVFSLAAVAIAAADAHQWQLPVGGYNAGVRQWGVDTSGNNTSANGPILSLRMADAGNGVPFQVETGNATPFSADGGTVITFPKAFTTTPQCACSINGSALFYPMSCQPTASTLAISTQGAFPDGGAAFAVTQVGYICIGAQ